MLCFQAHLESLPRDLLSRLNEGPASVPPPLRALLAQGPLSLAPGWGVWHNGAPSSCLLGERVSTAPGAGRYHLGGDAETKLPVPHLSNSCCHG